MAANETAQAGAHDDDGVEVGDAAESQDNAAATAIDADVAADNDVADVADAHDDDAGDVDGDVGLVRPKEPVPWWGFAAIAAFVALVVAGYVATALYPDWVIDHPLGLIALSSRIRNLIGALGTGLSWWSYAIVGGVRLGLAYVTCHLIGRAFGDRIYYVFGRYLGVSRASIASIESMFDKVEWLVVPWFVGSNLVAAMTGVRKISWRRLAMLVTVGIVIRLIVLWVMSELFAGTLDAILDWIARYQRPLTVGSIALVIVSIGWNVRRGRDFKLD